MPVSLFDIPGGVIIKLIKEAVKQRESKDTRLLIGLQNGPVYSTIYM